jgi:hypothetical protein
VGDRSLDGYVCEAGAACGGGGNEIVGHDLMTRGLRMRGR